MHICRQRYYAVTAHNVGFRSGPKFTYISAALNQIAVCSFPNTTAFYHHCAASMWVPVHYHEAAEYSTRRDLAKLHLKGGNFRMAITMYRKGLLYLQLNPGTRTEFADEITWATAQILSRAGDHRRPGPGRRQPDVRPSPPAEITHQARPRTLLQLRGIAGQSETRDQVFYKLRDEMTKHTPHKGAGLLK
jgi:hypothetical protein